MGCGETDGFARFDLLNPQPLLAILKMSRAVGESDVFSRSFMCLGFVAAALIIFVQWQDLATRSATATPTETLTIVTPAEENPPNDTALPNRTSPDAAQAGWATALEGVVEPALGLDAAKLIIDLSDRQIYFYAHGVLVSHYEIAVGRSGWETPAGEFQVINMQTNPAWQHPFTGAVIQAGAENPLGSRWIGFWTDGTHQIGLHGTNQEDLIGQAVSHGCIRLREADIQALYDRISLDMPVIVRP